MIPAPSKTAMIPWETKKIRGKKKNDRIANYIRSAEKSRLTPLQRIG